ncbi:MAG: VanZ family protein [Pseudomonadota bacterium]|nr:VanZ family protein [Pseudomonadota bacterium]
MSAGPTPLAVLSRQVRRVATVLCGGAAAIATVITLAITHFPPPSAVGASDAATSRRAVRGIWVTLGETAKAANAWIPDFVDPLRSDKTIHVVIFLVPAFLWALAVALGHRLHARSAAWLLVAFTAWGALDELGQHLTGRDGEWGDWFANVAGAAVGISLVGMGKVTWRRVRTATRGGRGRP